QAEDGIRDFHVTGVQTCALPIWFVYRTEVSNQYNTGVTAGQDNNFTVWNMSLGKKFLKDNKAEISLSVNDVLNENTSFRQNVARSEEHTSELQSRENLVCRLLLE